MRGVALTAYEINANDAHAQTITTTVTGKKNPASTDTYVQPASPGALVLKVSLLLALACCNPGGKRAARVARLNAVGTQPGTVASSCNTRGGGVFLERRVGALGWRGSD
jgi:hypothetical protein